MDIQINKLHLKFEKKIMFLELQKKDIVIEILSENNWWKSS